MFQQGVASEACTSDELEAANHPPSKRRKEDATLGQVADPCSAHPPQVQACFVFLADAGFVAALCRAGLSASLCPVLVILEIFQTFPVFGLLQ